MAGICNLRYKFYVLFSLKYVCAETPDIGEIRNKKCAHFVSFDS